MTMFVTNTFVFVTLLAVFVNDAASMMHTLMYFDTSSTDVPNFPQFVAVGYVNGLEITHFDSNTRKVEPKQEWMKRITEEDPQYWDRNTQRSLNQEQWYKEATEIARKRLNLTEGLHIHQRMYGCEWDDETDEINGYFQWAFDGEDFISFDLKTESFVAPRPEAVITKHKWERLGEALRHKHYITVRCVEYLKKYVKNGASVLKRKELPLVSFLQKSPSSPVTCHATGFYPDRAMLFWRKDGEELHEGMDQGVDYWEILPNHDGTFQKSADLDLTSVPHEDWERYECVFQLSGVEDIPTRLDRSKIKTNAKDHTVTYVIIAVAAVGLIIVAGLGIFFIKKKKPECAPVSQMDLQAKEKLNSDSQETPSERSEEDAEVAEKLNADEER